MTAFISGQAGRAIIVRGGKFLGIELDAFEEVEVHQAALPKYLGHSIDVEKFSASSLDEVRSHLEAEWAVDRALKLSLAAFDSTLRLELRQLAARDAESLLQDVSCYSVVLNQLYAAKLPKDFDAKSIASLIVGGSFPHLSEILADITIRQSLISECVESWSDVVPSLDYDPQEVARARYRLAKIGVFRDFVTANSSSNDTILKILVDPVMASSNALSRDVVRLWASKYKNKAVPDSLRTYQGRLGEPVAIVNNTPRRAVSPYLAFSVANKKIENIKNCYFEKKFKRGDKLVEYLISDQVASDDFEFVAKSLCNIAIFCRGLGDLERYWSLTNRAVELVPDDAWALVQLGNAYVSQGNNRAALSLFERAEIAGDERAALIGRADALRAVGQYQVALSTLERCIEVYPDDEVARNSRASLLAHFGELDRALIEYDLLVASSYANSHSYGGRALVLDDLGFLDKALSDIDSAIALSPGDMVPVCAKADVLRRSRKFKQALATLEIKKNSAEGRLMLGLAAVRVLRDQGDYKGAERRAQNLIAAYPKDLASKLAIADIRRKSGRFEEALKCYKELEDSPGFQRYARYSYASTFIALGKYDEASAYLSVHAATLGDWVSKFLLGMIQVKVDNFSEAEKIFINGRDACPWVRLRDQFSSALVHLRLRENRIEEAKLIYDAGFCGISSSDEAVVLLGSHLRLAQGHSEPFDLSDYVGALFKAAAKDVQACLVERKESNEVMFDSEWLALMSLAA